MKTYPNVTERMVVGVSANFLEAEAVSRYNFAKKFIRKGDFVLDSATGSGYGAAIISKKASQVIGIDISEEALLLAKDVRNSNLSFISMDSSKTIFKDKTFDVIIAFEMIEHISNVSSLIDESMRILKKDGMCIISTPNRLVQSPSGKVMSPYHIKEFSPDELTKILSKKFRTVTLYGQHKSDQAVGAVSDFMRSQKVRQFFVDIDVLNIRRLLSRQYKEDIWRVIGGVFGRNSQEKVNTGDFIFSRSRLSTSEYIIAVCKK